LEKRLDASYLIESLLFANHKIGIHKLSVRKLFFPKFFFDRFIDKQTPKYLVSKTFTISDLSPQHGDEEEQESRTTLPQGGEMM
jgi:hypothetical protein